MRRPEMTALATVTKEIQQGWDWLVASWDVALELATVKINRANQVPWAAHSDFVWQRCSAFRQETRADPSWERQNFVSDLVLCHKYSESNCCIQWIIWLEIYLRWHSVLRWPSIIICIVFTFNIIHETIRDSQDNVDGATQLLPPELKLVPKASPFKEEHSKTGLKMTQNVVLNYLPGIPKSKDNWDSF